MSEQLHRLIEGIGLSYFNPPIAKLLLGTRNLSIVRAQVNDAKQVVEINVLC